MKIKTLKFPRHFTFALILLTFVFASCKKDDDEVENPPEDQNEEELITTFQIAFTLMGESAPFYTATFRDLDGDGGEVPSQFDTIYIPNNSVFDAQITLLNETEDPAEDISEEVLDEADEHLFCFSPNGVDLDILRTDSDGVYEIGLESQWTTGDAGEGNTLIVLKHQPGIKDGSCDPGETDIELDFVTVIEE